MQHSISDRIDSLDETLFDGVPSQTSPGDRRSLLAIQRAVAREFGHYHYLEIGSYLGGSLQAHLLDARCTGIDSIDLRPDLSPDDRSEGCQVSYGEDSEMRMIQLLNNLLGADLTKLSCHRCDARDIDPQTHLPPQIAFIDGEHTRAAVLSDFEFCRRIIDPRGVIAFHDCHLIAPAIQEILRDLRDSCVSHLGINLEGEVFAIFFSSRLVNADTHLKEFLRKGRNLRLRQVIKSCLPGFAVARVKRLKRKFFRR